MFTQLILTEKNGLRFIHISGQVGIDKNKELVGKGNIQDQTRQALVNLEAALSSVDVTLSDVVKLLVYVKDYQYEHSSIIREELQRVFLIDRLPALTLIGIATLADERFLIEIDAEVITEISS